MKYPKQYAVDGEPDEVCAGDLVWWNEGVCVGFVLEVMEERDDYERWGLAEPSVAVSNVHPFAANEAKHKQHIGTVAGGGIVVYSACDLEDEGIGPLAPHERSELEWAITEAKSKVAIGSGDLPFCVSALKDMKRREEDWHIQFVDGECQTIETVVFPFRPGTRQASNDLPRK